MKTILIVTRLFAFVNLLFLPAIAVLLLVALISGHAWWFGFFGLPALFVNAVVILIKPQRDRVWRRLNAIAGIKAPLVGTQVKGNTFKTSH